MSPGVRPRIWRRARSIIVRILRYPPCLPGWPAAWPCLARVGPVCVHCGLSQLPIDLPPQMMAEEDSRQQRHCGRFILTQLGVNLAAPPNGRAHRAKAEHDIANDDL